ncbi:MAG: CehA/McbA family metallohydrolase [Armatimonadetes bacterium]|nr:CehA/McbA family metallohydrolase [Armatimonadota bacterium]
MTISHPYDSPHGPWLRGNLHTHTTNSDGTLTPSEALELYASHGYDFLCLSDHDVFTEPLAHASVVGIPGVEVSAGGPHLLAIGTRQPYNTARSRGEIINEIVADGHLCVLCHPNWLSHYAHWEQAALEALGPYHGIEIFNSVIDFLEGESHALDRWDRLLSKGRRLWGYAHDDFHRPGHGPRGWNMVCAERRPEAIIEALKAGRFYASSGVLFETIAVEDDLFRVVAPDAQEIRFITKFGKVLAFAQGPEASYRIQGNEGYLRAEAWGSAKQAAWTQPVFISEG